MVRSAVEMCLTDLCGLDQLGCSLQHYVVPQTTTDTCHSMHLFMLTVYADTTFTVKQCMNKDSMKRDSGSMHVPGQHETLFRISACMACIAGVAGQEER